MSRDLSGVCGKGDRARAQQAPDRDEQGQPEDEAARIEPTEQGPELDAAQRIADQRIGAGEKREEEEASQNRHHEHRQNAADPDRVAAPCPSAPFHVLKGRYHCSQQVKRQPLGPAPAIVEPCSFRQQHRQRDREPEERDPQEAGIFDQDQPQHARGRRCKRSSAVPQYLRPADKDEGQQREAEEPDGRAGALVVEEQVRHADQAGRRDGLLEEGEAAGGAPLRRQGFGIFHLSSPDRSKLG